MVHALVPLTAALLILKIGLAALFPVFGDESYYLYWGLHPAGGYYDLPPMIGWWLAPLVSLSLNPLWIRMFNLLATVLPAFTLYEWLHPRVGKDRALGAAALFFFLPLPFLSVISFPDVPLMFFSFFSAYLFHRAQESQRPGLPYEGFFSGVLWGCAFLSKYFAVFLLPVFVGAFVLDRGRRYRNAPAFFFGALPFVFQHLIWNRDHCWSNFVFNLITRQRVDEGTIDQTLGGFLVNVLVVSAPVLLSAVFRPIERRELGPVWERERDLGRFFFWLWAFPALVFLVTAAFGRGQGLHWLLFLTPFFAAWVALRFPRGRFRLALSFSAVASGVLAVSLMLASVFPDRLLAPLLKKRWAFEYRVLTRPDDFVDEIRAATPGVAAYFTGGYTLSSELEYLFRKSGHPTDFLVWGEGSRFGRTFDWALDAGKLRGKRIAIVTPGFFFRENWEHFFTKMEVSVRNFRGVEYMLIVGEGFRAMDYREDVLQPAIRKFYPPFLPGRCGLLEESKP